MRCLVLELHGQKDIMSRNIHVVATETFVAHRNLLFTVAYEMLGSAADAEDVLQDTWLRWVKVDVGQVRDHRAYLVRITTRQSLNRLRSMKRRRESYVGSWLPRAAAHRAGCGRRRRTRRKRVDGADARPRDTDPDRTGGVRAARGVPDRLRRDRGRGRQDPGRCAPNRPPRPPPRRSSPPAPRGHRAAGPGGS